VLAEAEAALVVVYGPVVVVVVVVVSWTLLIDSATKLVLPVDGGGRPRFIPLR
jgi:hypothetical protein